MNMSSFMFKYSEIFFLKSKKFMSDLTLYIFDSVLYKRLTVMIVLSSPNSSVDRSYKVKYC